MIVEIKTNVISSLCSGIDINSGKGLSLEDSKYKIKTIKRNTARPDKVSILSDSVDALNTKAERIHKFFSSSDIAYTAEYFDFDTSFVIEFEEHADAQFTGLVEAIKKMDEIFFYGLRARQDGILEKADTGYFFKSTVGRVRLLLDAICDHNDSKKFNSELPMRLLCLYKKKDSYQERFRFGLAKRQQVVA